MIRALFFYGLFPVCGYVAVIGFCRSRWEWWLGAGVMLGFVLLAVWMFLLAGWAWDKEAIVWVMFGIFAAQAANGILVGLIVRGYWNLAAPGAMMRMGSAALGAVAAVGGILLWPIAWE